MKILFIDSATSIYDTATYTKQPLGGTQSAVAGLSRELAVAGHEIAVINGVPQPIETEGVRFLGLPCPISTLNAFDVVIPVSAAIARMLREIGCTRPLVLWSHHATDQPSIQALAEPAERDLFKGFAFVSQWQADRYAEVFHIDRQASKVMRNAVSPPFLQRDPPALEWLRKGNPPVLAYTSTPYRGLDTLLLSFSSIRKAIPDASLLIFSGMGIYGPDTHDDYSSFYDLAQALPGVTYVGPLPQPQLAEALTAVDVWAYPSHFAETSCISAMEAMASGNLIVSTDLGALRETTGDFGHLTEFNEAQTSGMKATRFAAHIVDTYNKAMRSAPATEAALLRQTDFVRENYNWKNRATEWAQWLTHIVG